MSLATCDLSDEHESSGRVLPAMFRSFGGKARFSGSVMTVKCFEDNSRVKELVATPGHGRVLVVDGGGSSRFALLGDMLGKAAAENGWAGLVVYGYVRDVAALGALDLGVFALGAVPRKSQKRGEGQAGLPIEIEGVSFAVGDTLFADEDGVFVIETALLSPSAAG